MLNEMFALQKVDMETFYREALKFNKFAGIPEIAIVSNIEGNKNVVRYGWAEGSSVICLKYNKNTLKNLKAELKKKAAEVLPAPADLEHPLSEENLGYIITVGILTCNMLNISCPQYFFAKELELAGQTLLADNVVLLQAKDCDCVAIMKNMFHELRLLWQAKHQPDFLAEEGMAAIDAEAFATKLHSAITGKDSECQDEALKEKIAKQAESIELEEETVELLKTMINA